ncbi:MAG: hypothetical protein JNL11_09195 [Bdellovibrionaceae bacterium]|nr:hypothetical protein [Pseudobdellovibrionaceae bacterium]
MRMRSLFFFSLICLGVAEAAQDSNNCESQTYSFGAKALTKPGFDQRTQKCFFDTPSGLKDNDLADFNHLSEGADVFPYEWFMSLKSLNFKDDDNKSTKAFSSEMDKRFGFMQAHSRDSYKILNGKKRRIKYLMPYVGLSASWSTQTADDKKILHSGNVGDSADAYAAYENAEGKFIKEDQVIKNVVGIDGKNYKSIRMVGTNCALCHSSEMTYSTNTHYTPVFRVQGGPAMMNIKGFFKDMIGSTIVMFVKGKNLENFLADIKQKNPMLSHINPQKDAAEVKSHFCRNVAKQTQQAGRGGEFLVAAAKVCFPSMVISLLKASKGDTDRMFLAQDALRSTYKLLLNKTYGFKPEDNIGHLEQRMNFLAFLSSGNNPTILETVSAFNRTDAFGRISNQVLRTDFPVDLTAPVSLPWVWGLKYMANLHYNGNSNSVILRNVGQSLGLGAMVTSPQLDSTVLVHNLDRLENLTHKIKVPEWNDIFADVLDKNKPEQYLKEFEIITDKATLNRGFKIYQQECQSCHESNRLVGPAGILREYKMYPLSSSDGPYSPNTDSRAALNAIVPVKVTADKTIAFEEKIFNDVAGIKARYYSNYAVTEKQKNEMEFTSIRGNEFFRDTYLGSEENKKGNNYGKIEPGNGYKAKHLSGMWATAPFLHNGSVPNMMLLLTHESKRPKYFNVKSNEFDPIHLGFKNWERPNNAPCDAKNPADDICFNTQQKDERGHSMGNSNQGHNWGTSLSQAEKMDLINFLKYLPPEPEYAWESQTAY